jgi:electron transport complex protein RnfB
MSTNEAYTRLAEKWNAPPSKRLLNILEATFTPEESLLLMELFAPATCQELAGRLKMDEKSLSAKLEDLVKRGVLTQGKTQYAFHTSLLAFHHDVVGDPAVEPVPEKIKELWADYFYNEWWQMFVDGYIKRQQATGKPVHRVWPAVGALALSPKIKAEQILPEEDFRVTIRDAKRRIIAPCGCRKLWGKCEHPIETCFACFDNPRGEYYLDKPGRVLRELSQEECFDLVHKNEEAGLVHIGVCFCCADACEILYSLTRAKRFDLLAPSRYRATVESELCSGCQTCVERCLFDAIEMVKVPNSKKMKARINQEKCMGCGLCVTTCEAKAMTLEIARPPEYIIAPPPKGAPDFRRISPWGFYDLK